MASVIPPDKGLRIVGDVHGDSRAFAFAAETDRFVIQLGDLVDGGPDSAGTLRLMFRLLDEGRGLFLLGNHDRKLARAIAGEKVRFGPELETTLSELDAPLRDRALAEITNAPPWLMHGKNFFVHAAFHSNMLENAPPPGLGPVTQLLSRALFGETTGRVQPDGYPERLIRWVNHIPAGVTVYCGHDQRSRDGRPWRAHGDGGGAAIFLDTGAGKGGHLSWIDL
ncbi:MAG TPA: metallophosphoesterase [Acetobacteraceae bacterium]|nr:metallophosphoesterase [Acetobacteraceae bacterium]